MARLFCYHFIFVLIICTVNAKWAIEDCQTPDWQQGTCISIHLCSPMMELLQKFRQSITLQIKSTLKRYNCGFEGSIPKVCCPTKPIRIPGLTHQRINVNLSPPDVTKHKNIHLLPENCGVLDTSSRIMYGNETGLFEFPWMALLSYKTKNGSKFGCGGTIINERYILTAAHCINNKLFKIRVGEHDISTPIDCETLVDGEEICTSPHKDLQIEKKIPHPQYEGRNHTHDIALVRVARMNFSFDNIQPVCLPVENARNFNFTNRNAVVTGWGVTEKRPFSNALLKAELPMVPFDECKDIYAGHISITERQLCAGGPVKSDSCSGDSGGPLHVIDKLYDDQRVVQQGIVSFGPRKCGNYSGYPGVYTKVAFYMDWILDNMKP